MISKKLGPYQVTDEIGAGGMATVYRAYQASMDRHVAIKVIRSNDLQDPLMRERFRREARLIARLEHPHLLPVYDFDGDHSPPYIVMRYLEGGTLRQVLAQGELPHPEVLYMLRQVAAALDYAHRQGVVHRDLKPSNVMIDREGNAFVTDFGIARVSGPDKQLTADGQLVGTPAYMSPEQARGDSDVDASADIYALGAMVFEMLTGSQLYEHESSLGVLMAQLNEAIPSARERNPKLPSAVDGVLRTAVAKDRTQRHANAEALVNDLAKALKSKEANAPTRLQAMTQTLSIEQLRAFEQGSKGSAAKKETPSNATPSEQQRQMTALFVDVTEMASAHYEMGKDAETVRARMDGLWARFDEIAREEGGVFQSRTDDVGLALWGRTRISEDDPERAIRAALRMQELTQEEARAAFGTAWEPTEENPLPFSAGITTGPVLLERAADASSYSASGATITLAGRVREASPPGMILVSHDTFAQVIGVFTAHSHEPLRIRGRKDPIEVYVVTGVKPRAFRLKARGIEGIEIKMVGREIELRLLQEAFTLTIEDGETQVVTVVGEAGVGKSRLLYEFSNWSELLDQLFWLFEARATQPSMLQPYSLTRDLFSFRFQILDSDPIDVVHGKFIKGVAEFLGPSNEEKAELIGQLVGFDFSHLPSVAAALRDTEAFRRRALEHLGEFFNAASKVSPVVIHLEDVHWADDRSLDLINNLVRENEKLPMFVLCMARPSLYERRPQWGEGQRFHERIQLEPLSQLSSRRLVRELLKLMPEIPPALRDLVVDRADGNPFYIEELIKALIDDGVIVKGTEQWSVDPARLSAVRIPPTLTGVLQSRLDGLPVPLQQLLQRVSVIGRIFWDEAAIFLSREAGLSAEDVQAMLEDLRQREMILRREESGLACTVEFVFRHAILRDVTYETLVPRQRRGLHRLVADWLLEIGGERAGEQTLLVAEHFERAGEFVLAAERLRVAGDIAIRVGAYDEARTTLERALGLVSAPEHSSTRFDVQLGLVEIDSHLGRLVEARQRLEHMLPEVKAGADRLILGRTLGHLGRVAMWQDDPDAARLYVGEALPLARESGDKNALTFVLRQMGNVYMDEPALARGYLEESLALARETGNRSAEAAVLNSIGNVFTMEFALDQAREYYQRSEAVAHETKEVYTQAMARLNLHLTGIGQGDYARVREDLETLLDQLRELGDRSLEPGLFEALAWLALRQGDDAASRVALATSVLGVREQGAKPYSGIVLLAVLAARAGHRQTALEWIGCVRAQPSLARGSNEFYVHFHNEDLTAGLSAAEVEAAFTRGAAMSFDEVLRQAETGTFT